MGTFQVVYDDFSGGHYMGTRVSEQPKNTWKGNDVIVNPVGELIPAGSIVAASVTASANLTLYDHWNNEDYGYVFAWNGTNSLMYKYAAPTGSLFPITPTSYTLTGNIVSTVAWSSVTSRFYYCSVVSGTVTIYGVGRTGSVTTMSGSPGSSQLTRMAAYGLRLVGSSATLLYYTNAWTGTNYGSWSSSNYYEFDSNIVGIYPRTDDLLIACESGLYSLTGVLGSTATIQQIIPEGSVASGMKYGAVVNRAFYYLSEGPGLFGSVDGRLYRQIGVSSQAIGSFETGDYGATNNGFSAREPGICVSLPNGRIGIQFKTGWTYFEITPGVFGRSRPFTGSWTTSTNLDNMYRPAKSGRNANNEYMLSAVLDVADRKKLTMYRTLIAVTEPTYKDATFSYAISGTPTQKASGTVELAEYWHNKPFTVKEMFIEYSVATGGAISGYIEPTGLVDVPEANIASSTSQTISETSPPAGSYRMYRYWPNNASKGFGAKPTLTLTNCSVKRVILNCED